MRSIRRDAEARSLIHHRSAHVAPHLPNDPEPSPFRIQANFHGACMAHPNAAWRAGQPQ